jgi:hypothetical protein
MLNEIGQPSLIKRFYHSDYQMDNGIAVLGFMETKFNKFGKIDKTDVFGFVEKDNEKFTKRKMIKTGWQMSRVCLL